MLNGEVYANFVSCLIYISKNWPLKAEHEVKLDRTEMRMVQQFVRIFLKEMNKSIDLVFVFLCLIDISLSATVYSM